MKTKKFAALIMLSCAVLIITGNASEAFATSAYINEGASINLDQAPGIFKITGSALKYIVISPSSTTTLTAGGNQLFSANAFDQDSTPIAGINISWTVSNSSVGNINPSNAITNVTGSATSTFSAFAAGTTMVNAANGSIINTTFVIVIECSDYWDVNHDGIANVLDLIKIGQKVGLVYTPPPYIPEDVNKDGKVNVLDLIILGQNIGKTSCWKP